MGAGTAPGYFVFSLDTELAWGYFDHDQTWARLFSPDGSRERAAVRRLLALCDEYGVHATWAVVGHLFHTECERCADCPIEAWRGRYRSFDRIYATSDPLWYGADVMAQLLEYRDRHEIAFHGYTHRPFVDLTEGEAAQEATIWKAIAARHDVAPGAVVFPRNQVAHLDVLRAAGFTNFRAAGREYPFGRRSRLGAVIKLLSHLGGWPAAPTYAIESLRQRNGLLEQPPSAYLFDVRRSVERLLDALGLQRLRLRAIAAALGEAAVSGRIMHLWAHPWEFRSDKDFDKLRHIFELYATHRDAGRLVSVTMSQIARLSAARA